jgi:hypothetical protein
VVEQLMKAHLRLKLIRTFGLERICRSGSQLVRCDRMQLQMRQLFRQTHLRISFRELGPNNGF